MSNEEQDRVFRYTLVAIGMASDNQGEKAPIGYLAFRGRGGSQRRGGAPWGFAAGDRGRPGVGRMLWSTDQGASVPGRHITDRQVRLYTNLRSKDQPSVAAAKASISTAYRLESDPRLPSQKCTARTRRRPDPLAGIFDEEVVTRAHAHLRAVTIFEEFLCRHPQLPRSGRRTIELTYALAVRRSLATARISKDRTTDRSRCLAAGAVRNRGRRAHR